MKARRSERLIPLEIRQEGHQNLLLHQPEQTIAETRVGEKDGEVETAEGEKVTRIEAAKRRDAGSEEDATILGSIDWWTTRRSEFIVDCRQATWTRYRLWRLQRSKSLAVTMDDWLVFPIDIDRRAQCHGRISCLIEIRP